MFECKTCEVLKEQLAHERQRSTECPTCESLRTQLERVQAENQRLMNHLLNPPKPEERTGPPKVPEPIPPRTIPWNVRRQMLEAEDREKARILRDKEEEVKAENEILEKEVGVANGEG